MCGYLEEYIDATAKIHKSQAKDYEKVLKVGKAAHQIAGASERVVTVYRPSITHCEKVIILIKDWMVLRAFLKFCGITHE
jgi:hypothetical protein